MNLRIKADWIEALKSGRYKQTTDELFIADVGYCCLGVLTDLYLREHGYKVDEMNINDYSDTICDYSVEHYNTTLGNEIKEWSGLADNQQYELARLNDEEETDFEGIANYIENSI